MLNVNNLPLALGVSLLAHFSLFFSLSTLNVFPKQGNLKEIKVNYFKIKSEGLTFEKKLASDAVVKKNLDRITPGQRLILSSRNEIPERSITASGIGQKEPAKFTARDTIKLSTLELESSAKLVPNTAYLTYSNFLRERIRRSLYNKFSYINDRGTVCLRFAVNSNGSLLDYRIIEDKSSASDKLKRMAIDGLREASPFPGLPKELDSPVATFSVIVHFIDQENE